MSILMAKLQETQMWAIYPDGYWVMKCQGLASIRQEENLKTNDNRIDMRKEGSTFGDNCKNSEHNITRVVTNPVPELKNFMFACHLCDKKFSKESYVAAHDLLRYGQEVEKLNYEV